MTESPTPYVDPPKVEEPLSHSMNIYGWVLTWLGLAIVAVSFFIPVAAEDYDVINIGLLSNRELISQAGCALLLSGVITHVGGAIRQSLEKLLAK
jgi:hypothetical protein